MALLVLLAVRFPPRSARRRGLAVGVGAMVLVALVVRLAQTGEPGAFRRWRAAAASGVVRSAAAGAMFALNRKTFSGSYAALTRARRSNVAPWLAFASRSPASSRPGKFR